MPRGRKKKVDAPVVDEPVVETSSDSAETVEVKAEEPKVETPKKEEPKLTGWALAIAESRKILENTKLTPDQDFYESPEGFIMIGEKGKGRLWCRQMNEGKGGWINPRR